MKTRLALMYRSNSYRVFRARCILLQAAVDPPAIEAVRLKTLISLHTFYRVAQRVQVTQGFTNLSKFAEMR